MLEKIIKDFSMSTNSILHCSKRVVNNILLPVREKHKGGL